jgi:hypothetical protein
MMQTPKEIVQAFFPDAEIRPYPGYELERVFVAMPNLKANGFSCLSKVCLIGTTEEFLWNDALEDLKIRAQMLVGVHPDQRSLIYPKVVR